MSPRSGSAMAFSSSTTRGSFVRPLVHLAGEDHGGGRGAADHRGVGPFEGRHLQVVVQGVREDHEGAAVVAGDDAEDDRPLEVDHRAADLGAVFELPLAHGLGRAVEPREVGEHHERPVAAGRVDRPRHLLGGEREERAAGPLVGPVDRARSRAGAGAWTRSPAGRRGSRPDGRPRPRRSRRRACRTSAPGAAGPGRDGLHDAADLERPLAPRVGERRRRRRPRCGRSPPWGPYEGNPARRGRAGSRVGAGRGKRSPGAT